MRLLWLSRITARYASILAVVTLVPLLLVIAAYDRYASGLVDILTGTRLEQRMAMMHGRLASFVEARFAQLDTLANYPDLALAVSAGANDGRTGGVRAVLEYEADNPDLYGILIFRANGALLDAIPSQAASGAPYWGGRWEPLRESHPQIETTRGEVIGPFLPSDGRPGSVLFLRWLQRAPDRQQIAIALHIRLSSLTELLGEKDTGDLVRPLLITSGGIALSVIGRPVSLDGEMVAGPEVLPGWKVGLLLETGSVARPLATVREGLLAVIVHLDGARHDALVVVAQSAHQHVLPAAPDRFTAIDQVKRQLDAAALAIALEPVAIALEPGLRAVEAIEVQGHALVDHHGTVRIDHHPLLGQQRHQDVGKGLARERDIVPRQVLDQRCLAGRVPRARDAQVIPPVRVPYQQLRRRLRQDELHLVGHHA